MNQRLVKEIMQRMLLTCLSNTPIDRVARRMNDYRVHALVVVDDDGYAIGIVSQTDLLIAHCRTETELSECITAGDIMTPAVITCTPETTIFDAVTTMTRHHIHRLVVVKPHTSKLYPLGVISMTDIIRHLLNDSSDESQPALPYQSDLSHRN